MGNKGERMIVGQDPNPAPDAERVRIPGGKVVSSAPPPNDSFAHSEGHGEAAQAAAVFLAVLGEQGAFDPDVKGRQGSTADSVRIVADRCSRERW